MGFNLNYLGEILPFLLFFLLLVTAVFGLLTKRYESWKQWTPWIYTGLLIIALLLIFLQGYRHNFSLQWVIFIAGWAAVGTAAHLLATKPWKRTAIFVLLALTFLEIYHFYFPKQSFDLHKAKDVKNLVPIAVIGGGSAGLSAAMYTARARIPTIVFGGTNIGGELLEASYVENWPGKRKLTGVEMISELKRQAKHFGAKITRFSVNKVNFRSWPFTLTLDNGDIVHALAVIVTTGGKQRLPNIPGIDTYKGKGIGVCPICDGPFDKDQEVVVVGGGDAAADKALLLAQYAKKVTILVRGSSMRAAAVVQEYLKSQPKIVVHYNVEVTEIVGTSERANGVVVIDTKTNQKETIPAHTVYFALGFEPNSQLFKGQLNMDSDGYVLLKCRTHCSSREGVFGAGNIVDNRYQKAGYAAGDGIGAGLDAIEFMSNLCFTPQKAQEFAEVLYKIPHHRTISPLANDGDLSIVMKSKKSIVLLFHTKTCPECRELMQKLKITDAIPLQTEIVSADINQMASLAKQYKVSRVPVIVVIEDGKEIARFERMDVDSFDQKIREQFEIKKN